MTKLMHCADCGDLVAPSHRDMDPRWCRCERHAVWWRDGRQGLISVHDRMFPERNGGAGGKAWIVGIHNGLFWQDDGVADPHKPKLSKDGTKYLDGNCRTRREDIEAILDQTPDTYQFKQAGSLIVRISPGFSNDSKWEATVPPALPASTNCGKCGADAGDPLTMFCNHKWCTLRERSRK